MADPISNTSTVTQTELQAPLFEEAAAPPPAAEIIPARRKIGETKVSLTPPDDQFILRGSFALGIPPLTRIGGPKGGLFDADTSAANQNGEYNFYDLSLQGDFRVARLFGENASLLLGGYLRYSAHRGDLNTGGSYMNIGGGGLSVGLDWKNSMQAWSVLIPSRVALMGGILAGAGETTAGNHFSVSETRGTGYNFRAEADLFGLKVNDSGDTINLGWFYERLTIPQARGDAAYPGWATGPALSLALVYPGATRVESRVDTELCRADEFTLEEKIQNLKELQDEVASSILQLRTLGNYLQQGYGWTSEKINKVLRGTWVEYLTSLEIKAAANGDEKYASKTPEEVKEAIAALKPEFEAQANARYPEGTDHFDYPLPQNTDLSLLETLPEDCAEQEALADQLDLDREILLEAKFRVDERKKYLPLLSFIGEGNPINVIGGLSLVNFPPINFLAGKPDYGIVNDGPEGNRNTQMDRIEKFYAANQERIAAGYFFTPTDPEMIAAFRDTFAGSELPLLKNVVDQLTGKKELKGVREAGLDAEKQKALVQKIPILAVAHVSITDGTTPANEILANNRAREVELAMILMGMPADRIRSEGRGESDPVVPETLDGTKTGKKVKNLNWAKDKNRRVEFLVDFIKLKAMNDQQKAAENPANIELPAAK